MEDWFWTLCWTVDCCCCVPFSPHSLPLQINIACPSTGMQKVLEIDDERRLQALYDRRMAQEVDGNILGDEFEGYVLRISGGNDKQGFPMKQGVWLKH